MRIILILFLIVGSSCRAFSQSASEDLLKMNKAYMLYKDISMRVTYSAYSNYSSKAPAAVQQGFLKKRGDAQFTFLAGIRTLSTKDYLITIDSAEKQIVIAEPLKQDVMVKQAGDLEKILQLCSSVNKIDSKPTQVAYRLIVDPKRYSEFSSAEFYLDKKTYLLEKMVLYYNIAFKNPDDKNSPEEKPRLEVIFSEIDTRPDFPSGYFNEKQFINVSDKEITVSKNYTGYELINQKNSQ